MVGQAIQGGEHRLTCLAVIAAAVGGGLANACQLAGRDLHEQTTGILLDTARDAEWALELEVERLGARAHGCFSSVRWLPRHAWRGASRRLAAGHVWAS